MSEQFARGMHAAGASDAMEVTDSSISGGIAALREKINKSKNARVTRTRLWAKRMEEEFGRSATEFSSSCLQNTQLPLGPEPTLGELSAGESSFGGFIGDLQPMGQASGGNWMGFASLNWSKIPW